MKIVINRCFGGYSLSPAAYRELGLEWDGYGFAEDLARNDPRLVACLEKLGSAVNGEHARLVVIDIPDGVEWEIDDYDGNEKINEKRRSWP